MVVMQWNCSAMLCDAMKVEEERWRAERKEKEIEIKQCKWNKGKSKMRSIAEGIF